MQGIGADFSSAIIQLADDSANSARDTSRATGPRGQAVLAVLPPDPRERRAPGARSSRMEACKWRLCTFRPPISTWDETNAADAQHAFALAGTCEGDLARLSGQIGTPAAHFGAANRIQLLVGQSDATIPAGAYGANTGYLSGGATRLWVDPFRTVPAVATDDDIRALFVAELAEIMNSAWPAPSGFPGGLDGGTSNTEAISRIMTAELYPDAYYAGQVFAGIRLTPNSWIGAVSANAGGWQRDTTPVVSTIQNETTVRAIGCAILFLNFLRYQLDRSWHDILSAGGDTLAETYRRLTGRNSAVQDFVQLLEEHVPAAAYGTGGPSLLSDNPFPLLPLASRDGLAARGASVTQQSHSSVSRSPFSPVKQFGMVHLRACPWTQEKIYDYVRTRIDQTVTVALEYYGFAFPRTLSWSLRDPATGTNREVSEDESVTFSVSAQVENVNDPGTFTSSTEAARIVISDAVTVANYRAQQNSLAFSNGNYPGRFTVRFTAELYEMLLPDQVTVVDGVIDFDTFVLAMGADYWADRRACVGAFRKIADKYARWHPFTVADIPDPPPDWREALRWAADVHHGLQTANAEEAKRFARLASQYFGADLEEVLLGAGRSSG